MDEAKLTKDANRLICTLYRNYLEQIDNGISKFDAKQFGSASYLFDNMPSGLRKEDFEETCKELCRAKMLIAEYANGYIISLALTDKAIIYMENRLKNKSLSIIDILGKIPFIKHILKMN